MAEHELGIPLADLREALGIEEITTDPGALTVREMAGMLGVGLERARRQAVAAVEAGRMERVRKRCDRSGRVVNAYRIVPNSSE